MAKRENDNPVPVTIFGQINYPFDQFQKTKTGPQPPYTWRVQIQVTVQWTEPGEKHIFPPIVKLYSAAGQGGANFYTGPMVADATNDNHPPDKFSVDLYFNGNMYPEPMSALIVATFQTEDAKAKDFP